MPPDALSLDYDELARAYVENLHTALRNFSQGPEFLDGWAHDDDHGRSLLNMFEAARDGGVPALTVRVSPQTAATLDRDWLDAELRRLGSINAEQTAEALRVSVDFVTR
jgi:hypothetical protein